MAGCPRRFRASCLRFHSVRHDPVPTWLHLHPADKADSTPRGNSYTAPFQTSAGINLPAPFLLVDTNPLLSGVFNVRVPDWSLPLQPWDVRGKVGVAIDLHFMLCPVN